VRSARSHRRAWQRLAVSAAAAAAFGAFSVVAAPRTQAAVANPVGFAPPTFVDTVRAGGEPGIIHSTKFGTLVYSSHEGTTHIDRAGLLGQSAAQFACPDPTTANCYQNRVWIWTSDDKGKTWQLRSEAATDTGFSDPDLTEDASGAIYDTGIDLANDALFSSQDGGKTWPNGTAQCHAGDRPWLAGGVPGEVFLTTDDSQSGHIVLHSKDYGNSCDSTVISDNGSYGNGSTYSGFGKGIYDRFDGSYIEPARFSDSNGNLLGYGISRLPNARDAFAGGGETFQQQLVVPTTVSVYSPFGVPQTLSLDSAGNLYFAYDTDERDTSGTGGCGAIPNSSAPFGGPTPLPSHIMFVAGKLVSPGKWDFQKPISLAHQGNARVLWPWSVAGSDGNVSVVWYQMDKMVDPDCGMYNGSSVPDVNTYIYEAHISNATDPATRQVTVTNASKRAIHQGGICDSGTACVASGQDRRLGDYFTNAIDGNGCVIIASGDTTVPDAVTGQPQATSLPIFIQQNSGPSLTGGQCGAVTTSVDNAVVTPAASPASSPPAAATPSVVAIPNTSAQPPAATAAGAAAVALATTTLLMARRRRRRHSSAVPPGPFG
jgi:hypothetical protein